MSKFVKKIINHLTNPSQLTDLLIRLSKQPIGTIEAVLNYRRGILDPTIEFNNLVKSLYRLFLSQTSKSFELREGVKFFATMTPSISMLIPRPLKTCYEYEGNLSSLKYFVLRRYENLFRRADIFYVYGPTGHFDSPYNNGVCFQLVTDSNEKLSYSINISQNKGGLIFNFNEADVFTDFTDRCPRDLRENQMFLGVSVTAVNLQLRKDMTVEDIQELSRNIANNNSYLETLNYQAGFFVKINDSIHYVNLFLNEDDKKSPTKIEDLISGLIKFVLDTSVDEIVTFSFCMMEENHTSHPRERSEVVTEAQQDFPVHYSAIGFFVSTKES